MFFNKEVVVQFLYPSVRQFPFDAVCEQIVRELEKRNWMVPGLEVEFREYGVFRLVSEIRHRDFRLYFCRVQRTLPGGDWNDVAGVMDLVIPKKHLSVYEDESGPRFYLYVGDDYERDRERFLRGLKCSSNLYGEPRWYLEYKGECHCGSGSDNWVDRAPHTHTGCRSPRLVHTNDLNREYDPVGDEPKFFHTAEVLDEFKNYLEQVVLSMILSHPEAGPPVVTT
ncbi:MAG: hypothetical protein KBC02_03015 [Candidatus Pacebacteria bacterium]|nr:hypothetical protein [Candidatus Paceibacterota bacterium]